MTKISICKLLIYFASQRKFRRKLLLNACKRGLNGKTVNDIGEQLGQRCRVRAQLRRQVCFATLCLDFSLQRRGVVYEADARLGHQPNN